jgi:hypothetical protein
MEHSLSPANVAGLFNTLGTFGIFARPGIVSKTNSYGEEYHAYSDTVVEAELAIVDCMPVIRLVVDLSTNQVFVVTAEEKIEVSSYFNNGSGPFFRDTNGTEFCGVQRDGYTHWFRKNQREQKFQTPDGRDRQENNSRIERLNEEIRALKAELNVDAPSELLV